MSRLVTWPRRAEADATIRRFEPAYWTVDFPLPMMATVITTGPDALRVRAVFRTNRDLAGLIWHTEDRADHGLFAYHRARDCRGCVLEFDWLSSGIRPMDRLQSVSLTVETYRSGTHYVRLWNHATSGTPDACHIRMVLDETTRGGFYADTPVPWHDVKRLFISLQPLAAGRGNCTLAAPAAPGASTITLNVGDGGPITPGARVYILGSHPDVPAYTVTSATSGPVQTLAITPPLATGGGTPIPAGTEAFVETAAAEPIGEAAAEVSLTNITVTGPNSTLPLRSAPLPAHALRMADGFDNAYPFTPERLARQVHALGYRGPYVLYMGISKFHALVWDAGEQRHVVDAGAYPLNAPTVQWLADFLARLHALGHEVIVSVSFEILARFMPSAWAQRAHDGTMAMTGWEPPSSLIAPTHPQALAWLRAVFLAVLDLLPEGAPRHFQIGEPWWWDGSFGNHAPHIYDATTEAAYTAATGQAVPTPRLATIFGQPAAQHLPYLAWCRDQLGVATRWLVEAVRGVNQPPPPPPSPPPPAPIQIERMPQIERRFRGGADVWDVIHAGTIETAAYFGGGGGSDNGDDAGGGSGGVGSEARSHLLVFTPQILREDAPMLRTLNFPEADWQHPAFDVLQIEDYDWIAEGRHDLSRLTWLLATRVLGYPKEQIHYFAGFTLRPETTWIWHETDRAIWRAFREGPAEVFVWSREQVMRDGWTFDRRDWKLWGGLTHLAQCWRIERTDGVVLGFTSHDRPLVIEGLAYQPANAFSASQIASAADMSVGDVELLGALDAEAITAEDLLAGVYDHAAVELFVIDWSAPDLPRTIVRRGRIGTVSRMGGSFRAELRGLAQAIQQPVIDSYSPECRVDLYSPQCGVSRAAHAASAVVTALTDGSLGAVSDNRVFEASGLGKPDGWADYGELVWTSGANAGRRCEVRSQVGGRIELWEPMGRDIAPGDGFTLYAGCDKALATCRDRFANVLNFRGEPHVPGQDAMLRYPDPRG